MNVFPCTSLEFAMRQKQNLKKKKLPKKQQQWIDRKRLKTKEKGGM